MSKDEKPPKASYRPPSPAQLRRPQAQRAEYVRATPEPDEPSPSSPAEPVNQNANRPPDLPPIESRPLAPKAPLPVRLAPPPPPKAARSAPPAPPKSAPPAPPKSARPPPPKSVRPPPPKGVPPAKSVRPAAPEARSSDPLDFELEAAVGALPPPTVDPYAKPVPKEKRSGSALIWVIAAAAAGLGSYLFFRKPPVAEVALAPAVVEGAPIEAQPAAVEPTPERVEPTPEQSAPEPTPEVSEPAAPEATEPATPEVAPTPERAAQRNPRRPSMRSTPRMGATMRTAVAPEPAPEPEPEPATPMMTPDPGALPEQPTRAQVQRGMLAVRSAVGACLERGGRVPVRVTILGSTGRVAMARVEDSYFARQPMGGCIARAVRRAQFPRFARERLVVVYPYEF